MLFLQSSNILWLIFKAFLKTFLFIKSSMFMLKIKSFFFIFSFHFINYSLKFLTFHKDNLFFFCETLHLATEENLFPGSSLETLSAPQTKISHLTFVYPSQLLWVSSDKNFYFLTLLQFKKVDVCLQKNTF